MTIEMTEQEKRIQQEQVEHVFGLTGGELDDKPVTFVTGFRERYGKIEETDLGLTWPFHYDGVPEWAFEDFDRDARNSASDERFTLVDLGCEYGSRENKILIDSDGRIYLHVVSYANSGETECPGMHDDSTLVTEEQCPLCEADVGEEHGYIYIGPGAEHVYQLVGYERGRHPFPPSECNGCPECDDDGLRPEGFRIVDHGIEHEQYFQGHGLAHTKYRDTATGCGSTPGEALDDALDSLAQNGWDVSQIENSDDAKALKASAKTVDEDSEALHWYVSIDVR